jgi:hypothetical protein
MINERVYALVYLPGLVYSTHVETVKAFILH